MIQVRYHRVYIQGDYAGLVIPDTVDFRHMQYAQQCVALLQGYERARTVLQARDGQYRVEDARIDRTASKR